MTSIKIAIIGGNGRMGKAIIAQAEAMPNTLIHKIILKNKDLSSDMFSTDINEINGSDVVLDFSNAISTKNNIKYALKHSIPMVIGTTGDHDAEDYKNVNIPILWAPNTSISWNIMRNAIEKISLYSDLSTSLGEIHHINKKDNPSGTTKQLNNKINATQIWSLRSGDKMSMHQFMGVNDKEMVKIEHQVFDRQLYARDALTISAWLVNKSSNIYTMDDFLNDKKFI